MRGLRENEDNTPATEAAMNSRRFSRRPRCCETSSTLVFPRIKGRKLGILPRILASRHPLSTLVVREGCRHLAPPVRNSYRNQHERCDAPSFVVRQKGDTGMDDAATTNGRKPKTSVRI